MINHKTLPKGAFKCRWEVELYKLKYRKKRAYPENIELREGYRHLLWSRYARVYYERVIDESTLDVNLTYYMKKGILFLYPTGETIESIREEMDKESLTYLELMWRRQNEWDWFRRNKSRPTGDGDKFWEKYHKDQFQKYLKQKT